MSLLITPAINYLGIITLVTMAKNMIITENQERKNPPQKDCKLNISGCYIQLSPFNDLGTDPGSFAQSLSATPTGFNIYGFFSTFQSAKPPIIQLLHDLFFFPCCCGFFVWLVLFFADPYYLSLVERKAY